MARKKNTKRIDPRYFLHETVNRGELNEDIFSSIGNVASRFGAFGQESQQSEFWRRKGKKEAYRYLDAVYDHREYSDSTKDRIVRDVRKEFLKMDKRSLTVIKNLVSDYIDELDDKQDARDALKAEREAAEKARWEEEQRVQAQERAAQDAREAEEERKRAKARSKKEYEPYGTGEWGDVFDFSHQLEEVSVTRDDLTKIVQETIARVLKERG